MGQGKSRTTSDSNSEAPETVLVGDWTVNLSTDCRYLGGREVWPSALGLAWAITQGIVQVKDKRVLELGAGLGLPSFASERSGARTVYVSDRKELENVYERNRMILNSSKTQWLNLDWTDIPGFNSIPECDLVLGADIVYYEEQDPLVAVLDFLLPSRRLGADNAVFVLAYRERTDLDRAFLTDVLLTRFLCERRLILHNPQVELYWLRGKQQSH